LRSCATRSAKPALDVIVDMDPLDDGTIGAEIIACELFVDRPIEDGTYEQVAALLGDATEYPYSQIHYPVNSDGPGPTAPSRTRATSTA